MEENITNLTLESTAGNVYTTCINIKESVFCAHCTCVCRRILRMKIDFFTVTAFLGKRVCFVRQKMTFQTFY